MTINNGRPRPVSNGMNTLKKISIHLTILSLFIIPVFINAQVQGTPKPLPTEVGLKIDNPFKGGNTLMELITAILNNIIMPIAAVGVVLFIIYAGFKFVMAQGKPTEIEKAKQTLLWSLIGAGILLGAAGISKVVETTVKSLTN